MRQVNEAGLKLLKSFEQLRLTAYDDARPDFKLRPGDKVLGTLTIGYGHTDRAVWIGQKITEAQADEFLEDDLDEAEKAVEDSVSAPINSNQFSALASFAFNVGVGAFENSTLLRKLNATDFAGAAEEFGKWTKTTIDGRKVTSRGLVRRRAAEKELFTREPPMVRAHQPFSTEPHATVIGEAASKPAAKDVTFVGVGASIAAGVASQLEPLIGYSETIKTVFIVLSLASVGFVMWKRWSDLKKEAA